MVLLTTPLQGGIAWRLLSRLSRLLAGVDLSVAMLVLAALRR